MKCQPLEINKGVPLGPMLNVIFKPIDYHMQKVRLISEIINKIIMSISDRIHYYDAVKTKDGLLNE